jgi:membrane-associated phospholipid phosphatase
MSRLDFWLAHCRAPERVVLAFFTYTALLSFAFPLTLGLRLVALAFPVLLFGLCCAETIWGGPATSMLRTWALPGAVLSGYWQMGWFVHASDPRWQTSFLHMDRVLLEDWGLRSLIERSATFLPSYLELSYLSLYTIPIVCLAVLYWIGAWRQADRFLVIYSLGTLSAYALLPLLAIESPRTAFPHQDLPNAMSIWRPLNLWILNRLDISTSVFPSGHVATAFSCAFGMKSAMPSRGSLMLVFLVLATSVWIATIYGRYHYAVDGFASILICLAMWKLGEVYERRL